MSISKDTASLSRSSPIASGYTTPLSYRDIQKMMLYRGIEVTYEAIRKWCRKFAQAYANHIRRCRPNPADKWHLDEVVIKIKEKEILLVASR